jgi:hypothetical protein
MVTKSKPLPDSQRTARVLKETAGDGPSSYVVRVYDGESRLEKLFDSSTLNKSVAVRFILLARQQLEIDKIEFSPECSELEELWKKSLSREPA